MQKILQFKIESVLVQRVLFILIAFLALMKVISSPVALVLGIIFAQFVGHPFPELNSKVVNWLLKLAVIGLGFGMNMNEALKASSDGFILIVFSIFITLSAGLGIGYYMKVDKKTSYLISSGTAICGGSAIAAVSPIIKANAKEISVALGVVFFLNSIALIIFPPIGHLLHLTQTQFGIWSAIAIHDTSSVVGAAYAYGAKALEIATTVKLARTLWIIPISFITLFFMKGKSSSVKIPWFILFFVLAMLANSYLELPTLINGFVPSFSKSLLVLTLFLIGSGLSVQKIREAGWKPIFLGVTLWVGISVLSVVAIKLI